MTVERFDSVIVGGGSAGCVLANRLSEDPHHRVLLLEAGPPDRNPWIHVPLGYGKLFADARHNWLFATAPEPQLDHRRIGQPRGKVLGGSSSINGLVYVRGQPQDFDDWTQLGATGWDYAALLPYFRRSEDQQRGSDAWHGAGGPQAVSDQSEPHPLCDAFIAAGCEAGYSRNPDFNGAVQDGFGYYQLTTRKGLRVSTSRGYLDPVRHRANLKVVTGAHVTRIVTAGRRATGVAWEAGGGSFAAAASAEVLLCAGAIGSPHLLQVSGIGPADWLAQIGVEVVCDAPNVGRHLQDHLQVRTVWRARGKHTLNDELASPWRTARMALRYALFRKGSLTVSAGYAGAFLRTPLSPHRADIQALFINFSSSKMGDRLDRFSGFTASFCPLRPEARGHVRATSADSRIAPEILCNYLGTAGDRATALAGMRELLRVMEQPAIAAHYRARVRPDPAMPPDDEALMAHIRASAASIYHPTCSVRIGTPGLGAVDARLRVHGIDGLRVVDGSVMPSVVSGNTNAAIIAIAEKAADHIRGRI
jgi:choline dehydrogenase